MLDVNFKVFEEISYHFAVIVKFALNHTITNITLVNVGKLIVFHLFPI